MMLRKYLPEIRRHPEEVRRPEQPSDWMDTFFSDFLGNLPTGTVTYPKVNVSENDNEVQVKAELPGMEAKDIDLSFQNGSLVLKGEKKLEDEHKDENYHRFECSYGAFHRAVPLPTEVDRDKVEAKFKNGILEITMPKAESAQSKRIQIES